jgi:hypothetical protein
MLGAVLTAPAAERFAIEHRQRQRRCLEETWSIPVSRRTTHCTVVIRVEQKLIEWREERPLRRSDGTP